MLTYAECLFRCILSACLKAAVARDKPAQRRRERCAHVSIRQHTSAYVSIRQHTSAYVSIRQHTCAAKARAMCMSRPRIVRIQTASSSVCTPDVSIRQHMSAALREDLRHIYIYVYMSISIYLSIYLCIYIYRYIYISAHITRTHTRTHTNHTHTHTNTHTLYVVYLVSVVDGRTPDG
jgi:hypothetical protein